MMKVYTLFIVLFFFSLVVLGQRKISVDETSFSFKSGKHTALKTTVYEASAKAVSKEWEELMKDNKAKTSGNKEEVFSDNVILKDFNDNNPVDIYAHFEETSEGHILVYVAVDLGGAYLNSSNHNDLSQKMEKLLLEFAKKSSEERVKEQIKDAEKLFSGLESDQKRLVTENENLHQDIIKYNEKIKKAEEDIKTNLSNQEAKKKEIEDQLKVNEALNEKLKSIN